MRREEEKMEGRDEGEEEERHGEGGRRIDDS
jgi:hypothetical protein